jgi:hypothetical protein
MFDTALAILSVLFAGALWLILSDAATASEVFFYMDTDGTYSFTDDRVRVPTKYTPFVLTVEGMQDYKRYTPAQEITNDNESDHARKGTR